VLHTAAAVRLDVLRRVLRTRGHGDPHLTLADGAVWSDPATDRAADDEAWRAFTRAGLADGDDELDWLALLARPQVEYYGWITEGPTTTAVLAAATGANAIVANRSGNGVYLAPADANRLADAVVAYLPPARPGRGRSINVPRTDLAAAAGFAELAALDRTGAGEFHVAVRDRTTGRRACCPHPIGYQDTVAGRWLVQIVPGHDQDWVTATPATQDLLRTRLRAAHQALTDGMANGR
jgi:hypothetical protein